MENKPKKLVRVKQGKVFAGVCTGLGLYFDIDPIVIRIAFVIFSALGGSGLLAYIIIAIIMPSEDSYN